MLHNDLLVEVTIFFISGVLVKNILGVLLFFWLQKFYFESYKSKANHKNRLHDIVIVSSKVFSPTKFKSKIEFPPFTYPYWTLKIAPSPLFVVPPPHGFIIFKFPPTQNFPLIYSWFAQTDLSQGKPLKSCNSQEQKLIFQVEANLFFKYTNKHVQFAIIYPKPGNS